MMPTDADWQAACELALEEDYLPAIRLLRDNHPRHDLRAAGHTRDRLVAEHPDSALARSAAKWRASLAAFQAAEAETAKPYLEAAKAGVRDWEGATAAWPAAR